MARTKKVQPITVGSDIVIPKDLNPRDPDQKYYGTEPKFLTQPEPHKRNLAVMEGLAWYTRFYGKKEAKEFLVNYLAQIDRNDLVKKIGKISDTHYQTTTGWVARLALRGLTLNEREQGHVMKEVERLLGLHNETAKESQTGPKKEVVRPNVQEIMREKAREAGGEMEGLFDDFILAGAKKDVQPKFIDELAKKHVLPQHVNMVIEPWQKRLEEYLELQRGEDEQLNEAYSHYSKAQVKNIIAFVERAITELNGYVSMKKTTRSPRARKPVSAEKQVSKLKYMRSFKDEASKLDLVSLPPTKLLGASEAWIYDTAKRKLHHYVADDYAKTFGVKGNTVLGFCTKNSEIKTLRKPAEQIKEIMGSKPAARKFFDSIKAVSVAPNGRFNSSMIILRAF